MKALNIAIAAAATLSSCNQAAQHKPPMTAEQPAADQEVPPIPPPGTGPDAKTPFGASRQTLNPRSAEAAGEVVQRFGALIDENRLDEAANLWSRGDASTAFMKELRAPTHLEIGEPGEPEGAAGSIYITIPVVFTTDGSKRPAKVILRRVNDVPGSSDSERHWHIERIDWSG